jgi:hypothetical protein
MHMTSVIGARTRHWHDFVVAETLQTVGRTIGSGEVRMFAGLPRTRPTTAASAIVPAMLARLGPHPAAA